MTARIERLESRLDQLSASLAEVTERLTRLEEHLAPSGDPAPSGETSPDGTGGTLPVETPSAATSAIDAATGMTGHADFATIVALVGRTLLCLAGAYVPRALTSEGLLPQSLGVAAGLVYAGAWILMADRAGGRGKTVSASFHGATAAIVALPLISETTARFQLLTPAAGAVALAALVVFSLLVAWRQSLSWPAWIVSTGAGIAAIWLGGKTHSPVPYAAFLVLLGIAALWLAEVRPWKALPWVTAVFAHLGVLLLWAESPIARGEASVAGVLSVQLAHFGLYAVSCGVAARRQKRQIAIGAGTQAVLATLVGYGGAVAVAADRSPVAILLGCAGLLLACGLYALAHAIIDRERKLDVIFYTGLAVPLVLGGGHLLLAQPALFWAPVAILCSWLGSRFARLTLSAHAVIYALAAAISSGLFVIASYGLAGSAGTVWPPLTTPGLLALAAILACLAFPVRGDETLWGRVTRVPKLALLLLALWAGGGVLIALAASTVAGDPGSGADAAILATVRTAVLAAAALVFAWAGRGAWLREARWLVYPVLVLGGFKMLLEDFPAGRPLTLLVALALYGGALILAPLVGRKRAARRDDRRASSPRTSTQG